MLLDLTVSQLALVEHLSLHFAEGMTVITGETGAGKSILLTALSLILGGKADPILIRNGASTAEIHATFDLKGLPGALLWLAEVDLTVETASHECLIRRVLFASGRSKAYVNGRPVTQTQLKILGEYLVQMHGQHQHQMLLKPYEQLRLLDAYGQHDAWLSQCSRLCHQHEKLLKQKKQLLDCQQGVGDQLALLAYQVEEFEQLNLSSDEFTVLSQQHTALAHAEEYAAHLYEAHHTLETHADGIAHTIKSLESYPALQPKLKNCLELLNAADIHLQEANHALTDVKSRIELAPDQLATVESRLTQIQTIARKHRVKPEALYEHGVALKAKIQSLADTSAQLEHIEQQLTQLESEYSVVAQTLSKARQAAAQKLSLAISEEISELGMQSAVFSVTFNTAATSNQPHPAGNDQICFCVSANPGHPPQPLHKVASGGELSRISLAIQMITAAAEHTPTLIFDEADVGVGGETAIKVGQTLQALGKKAQVFCVTHLPQVAAFGQQHLQVQKETTAQGTQSKITPLTGEIRLKELARMLSGNSDSLEALSHAKTLLQADA